MKKNLTELVFILDRSGSMGGLENDTIGGYNSMLKKQKEETGEAIVTTVLFDNAYELLHDRINVKGISPITGKDYFVRGTTALLDAIGNTITKIGNVQKHTSEDEKAENVLFVITTDGMENASVEYTYEKIKEMIEMQKEKYGWEFIFLGANIDALATARRFGIYEDRSANYNADSEGTKLSYFSINSTVSELRNNKTISKNWKDKIDQDYQKRGKR
jgi:uncharacterized protein YegL